MVESHVRFCNGEKLVQVRQRAILKGSRGMGSVCLDIDDLIMYHCNKSSDAKAMERENINGRWIS